MIVNQIISIIAMDVLIKHFFPKVMLSSDRNWFWSWCAAYAPLGPFPQALGVLVPSIISPQFFSLVRVNKASLYFSEGFTKQKKHCLIFGPIQ